MYAYTPDVYMQQATSSYPMVNSSNSSGYYGPPMAYPSFPMPESFHQVPQQPPQLQQIHQQQQIQGFEGAMIPQQYFGRYEHMTAMQGAFPASASHPHQFYHPYTMPPLQSAASDAIAFPASACHPHQFYHPYTMPSLQSAASNAVGRHDGRSTRVYFSESQIAALNERFDRSNSIKLDERREMSKRIGLTEGQIKVWFHNRRVKLRKIKKAQSEVQMGQEVHQRQDDTMDNGEENDEQIPTFSNCSSF
ncbi:unnamed protein product [Caenorhabditis nigoni]